MSKASRLLSLRPFLFSSTNTQSICRRAAVSDGLTPSRPRRQRLLYTTRPLCATIVTSATAGAGPSTAPPMMENKNKNNNQLAQLMHAPTQEDIEEAELDVAVLEPDKCQVRLTEQAAEHLRRISTRENDPSVALRISVESGGCHGYQYKLDLTSTKKAQPDDYLFAHPTLRPSNIIVDAVSLPLLKGSTLDLVTELIGSSFRVSDNPQAKNSGCGCGVSWELKI